MFKLNVYSILYDSASCQSLLILYCTSGSSQLLPNWKPPSNDTTWLMPFETNKWMLCGSSFNYTPKNYIHKEIGRIGSVVMLFFIFYFYLYFFIWNELFWVIFSPAFFFLLALPQLQHPQRVATFEPYFREEWVDSFALSLSNFLNTIFQSVPLPKLLNFHADRIRRNAMESSLQSLVLYNFVVC